MTHTVSVIIASNRGGPYLEEAVTSVRAQTTPVLEIILVDDGSPEPGLADAARRLGVGYVRQVASGVSTARNRGVARATGRWIALLDDDDIWYPERIERQLSALGHAPGAIACYSDLTIIDEAGTPVQQVLAPTGTSAELMSHGNGVPPINTLLIDRETYLSIGGCDPSLRFAEDIDLVLRLLQAGSFAKADGALIGYRRYRGQATSDGLASMGGYVSVVRGLADRAALTGDVATAQLLRTHLRRTLPGVSDWAAAELVSRVRHGRWREAATIGRWMGANTRAQSIPAVGRVIRRRVGEGRADAGPVADAGPLSGTPR